MPASQQNHWDDVYRRKSPTAVSWYEASPDTSLALIHATGVRPADAIIDIGSGMSLLIDKLLEEGFTDISALDVSGEALHGLRERLGARSTGVEFLHEDVTTFNPERRYMLWHDRVAFHFLVAAEDRRRYVDVLRRAVAPHGHAIISTFGPAGPERCSNLPVARYDADALARELGSEFRLVSSSLTLHHTPPPWSAEQQFLNCHFQRES